MTDFTADLHSIRPPIPFSETDMDFVTHFTEQAPTVLDTSIPTSLNFENSFSGGHDGFFLNNVAVPDIPSSLVDSFPASFRQNYGGYVSEVESMFQELRKRKVADVAESSSVVASNSVRMNRFVIINKTYFCIS